MDPAARANATHSPPSTRPEIAAEAATAANVSARDSAAMIQAIWRRVAPVSRSSASSALRPLVDIRDVLAMPIAL